MGGSPFKSWYRVNPDDIINKKTKLILHIYGHYGNGRMEDKRSMYVTFKSEEELSDKVIKKKVEEFKKWGNVLESMDLYQISVKKVQKKLAGISKKDLEGYIGVLVEKSYPNLVKDTK